MNGVNDLVLSHKGVQSYSAHPTCLNYTLRSQPRMSMVCPPRLTFNCNSSVNIPFFLSSPPKCSLIPEMCYSCQGSSRVWLSHIQTENKRQFF